jgi:hypothetical protein
MRARGPIISRLVDAGAQGFAGDLCETDVFEGVPHLIKVSATNTQVADKKLQELGMAQNLDMAENRVFVYGQRATRQVEDLRELNLPE